MSIQIENQNKIFIFLSGLGESEDVWKPIVANLKLKNYKLLAVPGFGKGDKLEVLHQENFNKFLEKYLSEFDDTEICLVGHSLGSVLFLGANEILKKKNVKLVLLQFPYAFQFLSQSSLFMLKRLSNMSSNQIAAI